MLKRIFEKLFGGSYYDEEEYIAVPSIDPSHQIIVELQTITDHEKSGFEIAGRRFTSSEEFTCGDMDSEWKRQQDLELFGEE